MDNPEDANNPISSNNKFDLNLDQYDIDKLKKNEWFDETLMNELINSIISRLENQERIQKEKYKITPTLRKICHFVDINTGIALKNSNLDDMKKNI